MFSLIILAAGFAHCLSETCDLGIVGAGAGGAYAAWRAAVSGQSVCVFERSAYPGGRIHSLRKQGPDGDLVVEAGGYRFAPKTVYANIHNSTWKISTPLTAAIIKELGLSTVSYNPHPGDWDHDMHKIVDANGNDAGFKTFIETMLSIAERHGARIRYSTAVMSLAGTSSHGPVGIRLSNGEVVTVKNVLLNLPQHPLIELLRRSDSAISSVFPRPLYNPIGEDIMKLYVYYDDAWWRNDLNLAHGPFFNTEVPIANVSFGGKAINQMPVPLQGQYHDGDVRCDRKDGRCRGYLQAYYGGNTAQQVGGIDNAIGYYSVYHDSRSEDSVEQLTPEKTHHRELLDDIHTSLVNLHKSALDAAQATSRVSKMRPRSAVLSIWSQGVAGFNAGCHFPKPGNNPPAEDLPAAALQPLPEWPIFVANEAYGPMHCFAEASLYMATAFMKRLNISTPTPEVESSMHPDAKLVQTDPFLLPEGASLQRLPSSTEHDFLNSMKNTVTI